MTVENISQAFQIKNIDGTRNLFLEEIKQNGLTNKKRKKVCATPNYIEHFFILASTITGFISVSAFASLIGILKGRTSSAIGVKNCERAAGILQC